MKADPPMRIRSRAAFFGDRLADDSDDVFRRRADNSRDSVRIDRVPFAPSQQGVDIGMDDVRDGKGFERRVLAFPMLAEPAALRLQFVGAPESRKCGHVRRMIPLPLSTRATVHAPSHGEGGLKNVDVSDITIHNAACFV